MSAAERRRVVEAAQDWLTTPFHDGAALKGAGVDCAMFVRAVYAEAGVVPAVEVAPYPPQWHLHRNEELFLRYVEPVATEIAEGEAAAGDLVLFRFGRCFAHGAILADGAGRFLHAHPPAVAYDSLDGALVSARPRRFFTFWR